MSKKKSYFSDSLNLNMRSYGQYLSILRQISISMFEWKNIPSTIDSRYIEQALFYNAGAVYFNDEVVGNLALT